MTTHVPPPVPPARRGAITALDSLIRGHLTQPQQVRSGTWMPLGTFVPWAVVLGACYGFFAGWYALTGSSDGWKQLLAVMAKFPLLFLGTLLVTFPSLYVFNALMGSRLGFLPMLRLLVATIVVNLAIAASLGPILGFFTLSTTSYGFMVLLNVALLGLSGVVSVGFLIRTLASLRFTESQGQGDAEGRAGAGVFWVWILTYGVVGAQMGWILRPFIGSPDEPFQLFRPRDGSFVRGVINAVSNLF